jgi:hypothetical protein
MSGFIDTLITQLWTIGNYSAISDLHTLQFTVTQALGFSVFTSRILATDLWQSHCHFSLHMKFSLHSQIPFLAIILQLPNSEDSTQFSSSSHILTGRRLEARPSTSDSTTLLYYFYLVASSDCVLLQPLGTDHTENILSYWRGVFAAPLPSNSRPIVARVRFTGICLPSRYLAMGICVTLWFMKEGMYLLCSELRIVTFSDESEIQTTGFRTLLNKRVSWTWRLTAKRLLLSDPTPCNNRKSTHAERTMCCCSFNDAVSNSRYIASNDCMIMNWKVSGRKCL